MAPLGGHMRGALDKPHILGQNPPLLYSHNSSEIQGKYGE
jgi:hypothetical protein